jgi:plasmid maintenance system killer protein
VHVCFTNARLAGLFEDGSISADYRRDVVDALLDTMSIIAAAEDAHDLRALTCLRLSVLPDKQHDCVSLHLIGSWQIHGRLGTDDSGPFLEIMDLVRHE